MHAALKQYGPAQRGAWTSGGVGRQLVVVVGGQFGGYFEMCTV